VAKAAETFDTCLLLGKPMCFVARGKGIVILYDLPFWVFKGWGVTTWELSKDIDGTTLA